MDGGFFPGGAAGKLSLLLLVQTERMEAFVRASSPGLRAARAAALAHGRAPFGAGRRGRGGGGPGRRIATPMAKSGRGLYAATMTGTLTLGHPRRHRRPDVSARKEGFG